MQRLPQGKFMKGVHLPGSAHGAFDEEAECQDGFSREHTFVGWVERRTKLSWVEKQLKEIRQTVTDESLVTVVIPILK